MAASSAGPGAAQGRTIGLTLSHFHVALHLASNPCPDGLQFDTEDNWRAQFPTEAARAAHMARCTSVRHRGPNCENVWYAPTVVEDKLPFREAKSKVAYGFDLDGNSDGAETAATCKHEDFTDPDGKTGVDNQLYRVLACHGGTRHDSTSDFAMNLSVRDRISGRFLIEITDVDDAKNDDDVGVTTYQGRDPLTVVENTTNVLPFTTQRPNMRAKQYINTARGKIVDGVLTVTFKRFQFPLYWEAGVYPGDLRLEDARLKIALDDKGARGLLGGYHDITTWWDMNANVMAKATDLLDKASAPSQWAAINRFADGHKDPTTGKCSAISAAYETEFTRVDILHTEAVKNARAD